MPFMEALWFADSWCQNHSCMGSLPDSSAVREESGTKTSRAALLRTQNELLTTNGVISRCPLVYSVHFHSVCHSYIPDESRKTRLTSFSTN